MPWDQVVLKLFALSQVRLEGLYCVDRRCAVREDLAVGEVGVFGCCLWHGNVDYGNM